MTTRLPSSKIGGVIPAAVTPFREDYRLDLPALDELVRSLVDVRGVTGIVVNGVSGEVGSLSIEEQGEVVATAVKAVRSRVPVFAGLTAETARGAAQLTELASRNGASGVLVQAPGVFARGIAAAHEIAIRYFREVSAVGAPIIVFQHQIQSGRSYPLELLLKLLELPNIVAVKETVWDAETYEREVRAIRRWRPETRILCANDTLLLPCLSLGHHDGTLLGFASMIPEAIVQLYEAIERRDLKSAQTTNDRLAALTQAIYAPPSINYYARMKAAMAIMGRLPDPTVRPPLIPTPPSELDAIRSILRNAGLDNIPSRDSVNVDA